MSLGLKGLRNTTAECTKQTHRKVKEGNTKHTESQRGTKQNKTHRKLKRDNTKHRKLQKAMQYKTRTNTQKLKGKKMYYKYEVVCQVFITLLMYLSIF